MSSGQKVLKVFAIALAVFIIISICSTILLGFSIFVGILYPTKTETSKTEMKVEQNINYIENLDENVRLDIDIELSHLEIQSGDKFTIEKINMTNDLECKISGTTLKIEEKDRHLFGQNKNTNSTVILTIPKDIVLDKVNISMGIGRLNITEMKTLDLEIDAGMGMQILNQVTAEKTNIDGGAGNFTVIDSDFRNLDFDCGVGATKISGDIRGNSKISCGVGKTEIYLTEQKDNYQIRTETGLGRMTFNGEDCSNNGVYGNGTDVIKIEGGVGAVEITTK